MEFRGEKEDIIQVKFEGTKKPMARGIMRASIESTWVPVLGG